jgi:hypothetical protein
MRKVWVYQKGDELKVFATNEIAQAWFGKNDPEGVAFAYEVMGQPAADNEPDAIPLLAPGL